MLDPDSPDPVVDQHSYREHLLALNGLIQRRDSACAREKSAQMLGAILAGRTPHKYPDHILSGRFIEAVVRNYEITGNPDALRLAKRYAQSHIDNVTAEDGRIPLKKGHTHSYLGTLRGLLLYGEISKQQRYVDQAMRHLRTAARLRQIPSSPAQLRIDPAMAILVDQPDFAQLQWEPLVPAKATPSRCFMEPVSLAGLDPEIG